jgi:hypothetical protein
MLLYTDPGSGALLWQLLVAALIGGVYSMRKWVRGLWGSPREDGSAASRRAEVECKRGGVRERPAP